MPPLFFSFNRLARSSMPQGGKSKPVFGTLSPDALAIADISKEDFVPSRKELNIFEFIPAFSASSDVRP